MIQAMSYSATAHYLKAVEAVGTDEAKLVAWLHEHSVNDRVLHEAAVRADGRVMNDVYVVQVKEPAAITDPLDNLRLVGTLRADQVYPGPGQSACPLLRQAPL
jgi:branched-chain amino acid transport system substrate-binding protein